jgi:hypothetical protein
MIASICHASPSAIVSMVPRRILPERVSPVYAGTRTRARMLN